MALARQTCEKVSKEIKLHDEDDDRVLQLLDNLLFSGLVRIVKWLAIYSMSSNSNFLWTNLD